MECSQNIICLISTLPCHSAYSCQFVIYKFSYIDKNCFQTKIYIYIYIILNILLNIGAISIHFPIHPNTFTHFQFTIIIIYKYIVLNEISFSIFEAIFPTAIIYRTICTKYISIYMVRNTIFLFLVHEIHPVRNLLYRYYQIC